MVSVGVYVVSATCWTSHANELTSRVEHALLVAWYVHHFPIPSYSVQTDIGHRLKVPMRTTMRTEMRRLPTLEADGKKRGLLPQAHVNA